MKKLAIVLLLCLSGLLAGCGMAESMGERHRRILNIWDLQARMAVDDFDHIMLLDRSSRLTQWHPMIGD